MNKTYRVIKAEMYADFFDNPYSVMCVDHDKDEVYIVSTHEHEEAQQVADDLNNQANS